MHTPTHVIMGAAILGGRKAKAVWAAALGGLAPDLPMILIFGALKVFGIPAPVIFGFLYWQNWWQITNGIAHNFFLWSGLCLLAAWMRERLSTSAEAMDRWALVFLFSASALLHSGVDFLVHREDAHMSLWPLTRWKFISPVSYYDPAHYGHVMMVLELAMNLVLVAVLMRRFGNPWLRGALALLMLLYVAVPAYFIFH
ncbi:MAG: hypothetical protein U1E15_10225 [Hyphomicrobiales bacterium]